MFNIEYLPTNMGCLCLKKSDEHIGEREAQFLEGRLRFCPKKSVCPKNIVAESQNRISWFHGLYAILKYN